VALRAARSPFLHLPSPTTQERTCGSLSRTFSLPLASHLPQHRRENVRFFKPHVLRSSCIPSPTTQERERAVRRAARSPFLLHAVSDNK